MVKDVLDLRANNWVPRREEIKAKKITEIHSEAEKNLGLRPGATANMRNNRNSPGSPVGYPVGRPGTGGMMPGMPGTRKMPGAPGMDEKWEFPRTRSMPRGDNLGMQHSGQVPPTSGGRSPSLNTRLLPQGSGGIIGGRPSALLQGGGASFSRPPSFVSPTESAIQSPAPPRSIPAPPAAVPDKPVTPARKQNLDDLRRKTISLLEEYFGILILDEALQCIVELNAPEYHPEAVKEAIALALEKSPPRVEPVGKLLEFLLTKKTFSSRDIGTGCLLYASMLDDIGIDLPKAPNNFGELVGRLVSAGGLDFKVLKEILKKVEDDRYQRAIFDSTMKIVSGSPSGHTILDSQAADIEECKSLF
ncbi:hypothetical protein MLD38_014487 [Melastoma candidum]|uniref:Uncharacterized protein n=1 Tax=Melastoma candidum TaxID=119954 RepID=A0ACB9RD18_9MYRT|nr:hypothetical protein MLD38_014487 [Melastoma candidum]